MYLQIILRIYGIFDDSVEKIATLGGSDMKSNKKNKIKSVYLRPDLLKVRYIRKYSALVLLLIFSCYYCGISMFSHTHISNGSSIVHSHLGGSSEHSHSDEQIAIIDILSNFQSEGAACFHGLETPSIQLSESHTGYEAPLYLSQALSVHTLRGPPQA